MTTFNGYSLTYDADGQTLTDTSNTYTWDTRRHLTNSYQTGLGSGYGQDFVYDARGRAGAQQFARLLDADLGGGALGDAMLEAAHGKRKELSATARRVTPGEEVAQRRECLVFGRRGALELTHILAGQARSDLAEFEAVVPEPQMAGFRACSVPSATICNCPPERLDADIAAPDVRQILACHAGLQARHALQPGIGPDPVQAQQQARLQPSACITGRWRSLLDRNCSAARSWAPCADSAPGRSCRSGFSAPVVRECMMDRNGSA